MNKDGQATTPTSGKTPKLTVKETKFVKAIAEGKTQRQAYIEAYDTNAKISTIDREAVKTTQKPHVKLAIELALDKEELTPEHATAVVKRAIEFRGDTERESLELNLKGVDRLVKLLQIAYAEDKGSGGNTFIFNNEVKSQKFIKK